MRAPFLSITALSFCRFLVDQSGPEFGPKWTGSGPRLDRGMCRGPRLSQPPHNKQKNLDQGKLIFLWKPKFYVTQILAASPHEILHLFSKIPVPAPISRRCDPCTPYLVNYVISGSVGQPVKLLRVHAKRPVAQKCVLRFLS
jgi:hypothetical protein